MRILFFLDPSVETMEFCSLLKNSRIEFLRFFSPLILLTSDNLEETADKDGLYKFHPVV